MPRLLALAVLAVTMVVATGCESLAALGPDATAAPDAGGQPCRDVYSERRCLAMADVATAYSTTTRDDVAALVILPDPTPEIGPDGEVILQTLGGAAPIRVRLTMRDGTTLDAQMCMGLPSGPACFDEPPEMETSGDLIGSGYHDIPCPGEPPDGCPSPIPTVDPSMAAGAKPIVVPVRAVAIDHVGAYEVSLGKGSLPNGIVTEASYRLPDLWPVDVTFTASTPHVELRSLEPDGKPFDNAYMHGWRDGLERIEAVLVFGVKRFDPGATVEVRDVHVR